MEKTEEMKSENIMVDGNDMTMQEDNAEEKDLVIILKKPIKFEGELYSKIDLSGLRDIKAADMVSINRRLTRNGNVDTNQELTLEYALYMAHMVTGKPMEFFDQIPPYAAMALKSCVISFLFSRG